MAVGIKGCDFDHVSFVFGCQWYYESLQKMVQGLVKGLDVERKEISVEAVTVLSVNPKQLMDECEELLAKIVDSLSKPLLMD